MLIVYFLKTQVLEKSVEVRSSSRRLHWLLVYKRVILMRGQFILWLGQNLLNKNLGKVLLIAVGPLIVWLGCFTLSWVLEMGLASIANGLCYVHCFCFVSQL